MVIGTVKSTMKICVYFSSVNRNRYFRLGNIN